MTAENKYIDILSKLIGFDTVSSQSNLDLIDYIREKLQQKGFETQVIHNEAQTKANLMASIGPEDAKGILLAGHTDVVPVDGQPWDSDPFELTQQNGVFIGRGTSDMKGFLALVLDVCLNEIDTNQLHKPIHLVFTYDEEVGCFGAKALSEYLNQISDKTDFALIGEPTNYKLVNAHKGLQATTTYFKGKPAHSSCPHLGQSAILAAVEFAHQLKAVMPSEIDDRFSPPYTTFNIGTISGGNALNIIAEHCEINWEYRPIPNMNPSDIYKTIEQKTQQIRENTQVEIHHDILSVVPGLSANNNLEAIKKIKNYLPSDTPVTTAPFVTEAGLFEQANIQTVVFGPGEIEQAHQPNEQVSIDDMNQYRQFLKTLISGICLQ